MPSTLVAEVTDDGMYPAVASKLRSPRVFTKTSAEAHEHEWQFAWRPTTPQSRINALTIKIGSIESFAELRDRESYPA